MKHSFQKVKMKITVDANVFINNFKEKNVLSFYTFIEISNAWGN